MWPLSSRVRRRKLACSLGFAAPRSGPSFRGANVRAAARLPSRREMPVCCFTAFLLHHRFRAAWSAGEGIVGSQAATNSQAVSSGHATSGVSDGLTIRSSGRPNRFAFGPPLSSGVRRLVLRLGRGESVLSKPRLLAARHPARPRRSAPRRKSDGPQSSRCWVQAGAGTKNRRPGCFKSALRANCA